MGPRSAAVRTLRHIGDVDFPGPIGGRRFAKQGGREQSSTYRWMVSSVTEFPKGL
jgi:hypothetical protein